MTLQNVSTMSPQFMLGQLAEAKNQYQHNYNKSSTSNDGMWNVYTRGQVSFLLRERVQRGGDEGGMRMRFFENLVFPNAFCMVPSCSHQMPNGFNLLCLQFVPQVPNKTTLYPICFAQSHLLVNYIGSIKEYTRLCSFWDWLKLQHGTTRTWLCRVKKFYFRSQQKSVVSSGWWPFQKFHHQMKEKVLTLPTQPNCAPLKLMNSNHTN